MQNEDWETKDDTTDKQIRDTALLVEERSEFEIHLRAEGVPQDDILKDEEQMKEINKTSEKLKSSTSTKSIRDDLKKKR